MTCSSASSTFRCGRRRREGVSRRCGPAETNFRPGPFVRAQRDRRAGRRAWRRTDGTIAAYARKHDLCILTRDFDFADVRVYPPDRYSGIVVFELPETANRDFILSVIALLLRQTGVVERLAGRLAIVDVDRVRLRPAD
ncbi:MAG: DUF5615 family PIN-like protein [Phycisphaerales bacterium]|nr:DUF5615 family PIN-like protein [Phycisphaerales bacterium]